MYSVVMIELILLYCIPEILKESRMGAFSLSHTQKIIEPV